MEVKKNPKQVKIKNEDELGISNKLKNISPSNNPPQPVPPKPDSTKPVPPKPDPPKPDP